MTTGTTVARSQEAQSYLDRVGAALADLPDEERADLLDELGTHVDEIAAEGASSLEARLGSPEDYAAELRASAGGQVWLDRPFVASMWDFLGSLRPAWWVLRGWLIVAAVALAGGQEWSGALVMVPAGMLGWWTLASVVASVQLGRGLLGSGGRQVWNIYPYDAAGRMLHDVRLYDQDGNPLSLGLAFDPTKQQTLDAAGQKVDNAFPYRYLDPTTGEVADPEAASPIAAPPLLGVPAATPAAPAASASATASPTPTNGKP